MQPELQSPFGQPKIPAGVTKYEMKKLLSLIALLAAFASFGQETKETGESVYPLQVNPYLFQDKPAFSQKLPFNSLDSTFIYNMDTLDTLPVRDDFSISKFEKYKANYSDGNVTSQYYYALLDPGMVPLHVDSTYCDSTYSRHDTISIVSGIPTTFTSYFPTVQSVNVSELCNYPVTYTTMNLYRECYVLIDSVIDGVPDPTQDTIFYTPTIVQDSANLFFVAVDDKDNVWVDNFACHNYRFPIDPWSLGVVTMDGVDENGMPYDFGNAAAYEEADHLTSKHINLSGKTNVYLTFIYQPGGYGNDPETQDSLLLDFWEPDSNAWYPSGWKTDGDATPDVWDTVHWAIPLALLDNGFRFRFRNWASTSAALDHWHIDYIRLEDNLTATVDPFSDLAIQYPINTLIKDYTAVPWDHFRNVDPATKMLDKGTIFAFNSDNDATNYANGNFYIEHESVMQLDFTLPNPGAGGGWTGNWEVGTNAYPYDIASIYSYDNTIDTDPQTVFDVRMNIDAAVSASNVYAQNDTTYFQQKFDNYYSYDDGSAEAAYGLNGSFAKLAYEFESYELDTLTGILMHFVPWVDDLSSKIFLLTVWEDSAGVPGKKIYQDDFFEAHSPEYEGSKSGFRYYEFYNEIGTVDVPTDPKGRKGVVLTGTKFYVGWEQLDDESLQIGLDWNIDNGEKIWRNTSGTWLQSSFDCSLLIRPVFSTGLNYTLNIPEEEIELTIGMYPNPTNGELNFSETPEDFSTHIFDMSGRLVLKSINEKSLDISFLNSGVYLVDLRDENGISLFSDKLIKR